MKFGDKTRQTLSRDVLVLFASRIFRMFAYGFVSVILVLYLAAAGLSQVQIGLLLSLTLLGDTVLSFWMAVNADRIGRRRMLQVGALLMFLAGLAFTFTGSFTLLLIAAIVGVLSPSGHEVGPFLSIEQAALSEIVTPARRTHIFSWYNLAGSFATAIGAISAGVSGQALQNQGFTPLASYRGIIICYAVVGLILTVLFSRLSPAVETSRHSPDRSVRFGLHQSRKMVLRISGLFALDAFAGGFVMQSILSYWFHIRFGAEPAMLGAIFFMANILAGISALFAAQLAARIGLIKTMVFTHLPSNVLLFLIPFMPTLWLAVLVLLLRFSISQMDVPTRQAFMMSAVPPQERSAAAGLASVARSIGASISPVLTGPMLASATLFSLPFFFAGSLKIVYDLLLYRNFVDFQTTEKFSDPQDRD